jgi:hypothetical protein
MPEQRNPYKGNPVRSWLRLGFRGRDGTAISVELLADTGSPQSALLRPDLFDQLVTRYTRTIRTNFGDMTGGWVQLYTPEIGLVEVVEAFRSEQAARTAAKSHPAFAGVVGLPILRLGEYGGNADVFWIREPS